MKVEFKAVFSHTECQKFGEYVIKYCSPEYNKVLKRNIIAMAILTGIAIISGILSEIYVVAVTVAFAFIAFVALLVYNKNKKVPQSLCKSNMVGVPYNVTYGFYDEYFYEKSENNMSITETSARYEFLDHIIETPEYFLLLSKRRNGYIFHKSYVNFDDLAVLSNFFKTRLPNVYKFKEK